MSITTDAEQRSRTLADKRKDLSRRTNEALKKQRSARAAREKMEARAKSLTYDFDRMSFRASESRRGRSPTPGDAPPSASGTGSGPPPPRKVGMKDPAIEHMRKMRQLEEEKERAMREQAALLAAKEAAFEKAKKEEAFQRQLQVQAAQREVIIAVLTRCPQRCAH